MSRLFITCAAIALLTAPAAHASLSFNGGSLMAASGGSSASAEVENPGLLEILFTAFNLHMMVKAAAPTSDASKDSGTGAVYECEDAKEAAADEKEEKEAKNTRTGEPVYLAF